ncbi:exo-alpha-sialidase [Actinoplanes sp. NPDC051861]|uniref:discoidin domain-containing protein n=1 Tax=Actinoplanes sp. NPDC051861 TaxID=3155170 RepID=UPI00342329AD
MTGPLRRALLTGAAATLLVATFGSAPAVAAPSNDPTCATAINGTPAYAEGQSATGYALNVGGWSETGPVWNPPGDTAGALKQAAFPNLISADSVAADGTPVRKHYARFSEGADSVTAPVKNGQVYSLDGGVTWPTSTYIQDPPPAQGAIRLRGGDLLSFAFKPVDGLGGGTRTTHMAYRSADDGATWTASPTTFDLVSSTIGARVAGVPLELPDGTILVTMYGTFTDGPNHRVQLQASTDGGQTFSRRAVIANGNASNGYNETAIAQLPGGKLITVMRHQVADGNGGVSALGTPVWSSSTDNGFTWTALQNLQVSFPYGYDPVNDSTGALEAVAPDLKLMPNGVLVLRSGRPDNWVAISTNGQGTGWVGQLTYRNCPTTGARFHGSTGYGAIDYLSANRAIVIGDTCETTWSCPNGDSGFTVKKETEIWKRWIDVLTPDVGRIDLATKYRKGVITVSGNMTSTVPGHVRARVDGTFDGSTEHWSSAVNTNGNGTYVINLDRTYPLTKIGLALRNGRQATGRVYLSSDGVNWGSPVVNATNRTHLAMEYFTLSAPANARFVKVEADAGTDGTSFINELELYSSINSFENDPVNNRPRGFSNIVTSWQTTRTPELDDNDSASALRIIDTNPNAISQVTWNSTSGTAKTFEFRLKPVSLVGFLFDLLGKDAAGNTITPFHFAVGANGEVSRYNGSAWVQLTGAGAVPENTWSTLTVTVNTSTAAVSLNGTVIATGVPYTAKPATLHGYRLASNGTATTGDNYLVDDVLFTATP